MLSNISKIVLVVIIVIPIVLAGIVTAIVVGGGAYLWQTSNHIEVQPISQIIQVGTVPTIKTSQELMEELLLKVNSGSITENYKIFEEVKNRNSTKSAVLFGLDIEKTKECCSKPIGIFINNQGGLGAEYDILQGALQHMYLENAKWQNDESVLYDLVISDEGGKQTTQKSIAVDLKSYTNDKYGFEIKYPSDWTFQSTADGKFTIKSPGEVSPILKISFLAETYADFLSAEQVKFDKFLKESLEKPGGAVNAIVLDGKPAKEFLYYSPIGYTDQVIIATNNGYTIKINSFKNSILDSVLSTFKLTK